MNHVWQHKGLLASQIPGSIDDLKGVENDFYRKVFLNKNPDYRRDREMAAINAADVAKPEEIKAESASCLIKMTKPCFASFKQAFLDAGSRVRLNSDLPEIYASALETIRFVGGSLDGVDIELSDHLNAVIGGRGTGKSTLLECIRFAFDLTPLGKEARRQHDSIVKKNLGIEKGMVEVSVRSAKMHGRKFTVGRKYGSHPIVTNEAGEVAPGLANFHGGVILLGVEDDGSVSGILSDPDVPNTQEGWQRRLLGLGFLTDTAGQVCCTIAGLVLFGKNPRRFLKQAGLRVMAFRGNDKEYQAEYDQILDGPMVGRWESAGGDRRIVDGGLIERFVEAMNPYISQEADHIDEGFRREAKWFYPPEAVRETVINALGHRDWTRFVEIEVGSYSDRFEVISPATLQNSMTVEKMKAGQRSPRNTLIMEVLRDYGYVDYRGWVLERK